MAEVASETDVVLEHDVVMTTSDGIALRSNVYRPAMQGSWPALLMRTAYGKDGQQPAIHVVDPERAARAGFVVVVQDCRGRFSSEGVWRPYEADAEDGAEAVQWAATLPSVNGRVGMYGASYQGSAQLAAESLRPAALRAIAPTCCWFDQRNGQTFRGGALELGKLARWTLINMPDRIRRRVEAGETVEPLSLRVDPSELGPESFRNLPLATFEPVHRHDPENELFDYVQSGPDARQPLPRLRATSGGVRVPALWISGWFDAFLVDALNGFGQCVEAGVPTQLVVGPWTHANRTRSAGEVDFGPAAGTVGPDHASIEDLILGWFCYWLKPPVPPSVAPSAPVRVFLMGANRWETPDRWPPGPNPKRRWYLAADGSLEHEPPAEVDVARFVYDPENPVPTLGGATIMGGDFPAGPVDQSTLSQRPDVLVFQTAPLDHEVVAEGPVSVELFASTSAPDTDFVARLIDVDPLGRQLGLTDGIVRARYARSKPRRPGEVTRYRIDLWATAYRFAVGHRIGLHVTSSSFPRWDRNLNTNESPGTGVAMSVARQEIWTGSSTPSCLVLEGLP